VRGWVVWDRGCGGGWCSCAGEGVGDAGLRERIRARACVSGKESVFACVCIHERSSKAEGSELAGAAHNSAARPPSRGTPWPREAALPWGRPCAPHLPDGSQGVGSEAAASPLMTASGCEARLASNAMALGRLPVKKVCQYPRPGWAAGGGRGGAAVSVRHLLQQRVASVHAGPRVFRKREGRVHASPTEPQAQAGDRKGGLGGRAGPGPHDPGCPACPGPAPWPAEPCAPMHPPSPPKHPPPVPAHRPLPPRTRGRRRTPHSARARPTTPSSPGRQTTEEGGGEQYKGRYVCVCVCVCVCARVCQ
jgi:hypothetical protein